MDKRTKRALFVAGAAGVGYYLAGLTGAMLLVFLAVAGL